MKSKFVRLAGLAGLVAWGSAAQAGVFCDTTAVSSGGATGGSSSLGLICPAAAPAYTSESIEATIVTQVLAISQAIRLVSFGNPFERRLAGGPGAVTGLAAGDAAKGLTLWSNLSHARIGVEYQPLQSSGSVDNLILGADYRVTKSVAVGASLALDRTRVDTDFNNGTLRGDGYSFAPYVAVQIDRNWSADFSAGVGQADQRMSSGGIDADLDADRSFYAGNLNYERWTGDWQWSGRASYLDSAEEKLGQKDKLRQLRLGVQLGYWANGMMPYASVAYSKDLRRPEQAAVFGAAPPANDETTWVLGVGVNIFTRGAWSGGVSYTSELDRKESKQNVFTANLAYRF